MFEVEYEFGEEDLIHFNELQFMRNEEIQYNIKKIVGLFQVLWAS